MGTTNHPNGVSTAPVGSAFENFILPDSTRAHLYYTDFDVYDTDDWEITAPLTTAELISRDGGWLDTDVTVIAGTSVHQSVSDVFGLQAGKQTWFKAQIEVDGTENIRWAIGLQPQNTVGPSVIPTEGVWLQKANNQTNIAFHISNAGAPNGFVDIISESRLNAPLIVGFHFDGVDTYRAYLDDVLVATFVSALAVPTDLLRVTFAFNTSVDSESLLMDYILVAQER